MHELPPNSQIEHCTILTTLAAALWRHRCTWLHFRIVALSYKMFILRPMLYLKPI
jgi:hypothetical protein